MLSSAGFTESVSPAFVNIISWCLLTLNQLSTVGLARRDFEGNDMALLRRCELARAVRLQGRGLARCSCRPHLSLVEELNWDSDSGRHGAGLVSSS